MSSITPVDFYHELRTGPVIMAKLEGLNHTDDIAAKLFQYATANGHKVKLDEIHDGLRKVNEIVADAVGDDELSDFKLEVVHAGSPAKCGDDFL